jgi:hypothetical protein
MALRVRTRYQGAVNLRALPLLLLFATQALASGVTSVVHLCTKTARPNACRCPGKNPAEAPDGLKKGDCCLVKVVRGESPLPSTARLDAPPSEAPQATAPVLAWLPLPEGEREPAVAVAWLPAAPAQGPPIYLQLRSFLN